MEVKLVDGKFVITIPQTAPRPSKSGKTNIVASTGGFQSVAIGEKVYQIAINICEKK